MKGRRRRSAPAVARQRFRVPAAALALAGVFALKLAVLFQFQKYPLLQADAGPDTVAYLQLARQAVDGNPALGPGLYVLPPLYIYFLALLLRLTESLLWVRIAQAVLGTVAVALVFRTASLWHGRRAAWFAGALAAFTGIFSFYEVLVLQTAIDPILTALALWLFAAALRQADASHPLPAAAAGAAFGLFALNHPQVLIAVAGLLLLLIAARRWRTALLATAGVALALAPLVVRNYAVAVDLAPASSHGGLEFYIGNNPEADGTHRTADGITPSLVAERDVARKTAEKAIGRALDDSEVSAHFYGLGWKWIASQPGAALRLFARKLALVFNAAHPSLNYSFVYYSRDEHNLLRYLPVGPWLLVPLGVLGLWLGAPAETGQRRAFWLWASFVPLYAVSVAVFFVSSRHRLPILVPLCVTAGAVLDILARRRSSTAVPAAGEIRGRTAVIAALVVAALAVFANWRTGVEEGRTEERTRMALWLIGQQRYDEAESRVADLERGHSRPGLLHFRVGRALMVRAQSDKAIRHLERARALDPAQPELDLALGQALLAGGRPKEAIPPLRRAFDGGLQRDITGFDLARAHAAAGDRASAVAVLQRVRPERADDGESWRALGELALELNAPRLAEAFLRQAIRADPKSVDGYEKLGLAMAIGGRFNEAVGAFEQAARLNPRDASVRLNLAVALAEVGRVAEARTHAEESLRLDPSYDKARQFLAAIAGKKLP